MYEPLLGLLMGAWSRSRGECHRAAILEVVRAREQEWVNRFFVEAGWAPSQAPAVGVTMSEDPGCPNFAVWIPDSAPAGAVGAWK